MALVNRIDKSDNIKTWKHFAEAFVEKVKNVSKGCDEIRLVFDRYISQSLKSRTRKKRTSGNEVRYIVTSDSDISKKPLKQLLAHIETKQALTEYLAEFTMKAMMDTVQIAITYSQQTISNIQLSDDLMRHDHEEADTLIVLHALNVAKNDPFSDCVVVASDTDVFLLLIHYYERLPMSTVFRIGTGDKERDIPIMKCYNEIGPLRAQAILGFHVLTGCDQIGRFSGKSKTTCWNEFFNSDSSILSALANLGIGEDLPDLNTLDQIERFVVNIYGGSSNNVYTLPQLRWFQFSKCQYDASSLPPTMSALKYKIFRAHFVCMVLKRSHHPFQQLPDPLGYGWELNGTSIDSIMTDNLPAPIALIELSMCKCKTGCQSKRCKCLKNNLICTDMCRCTNCKNDGTNDDEDSDDE
ncbi:uncharacterized protein [Clytia hemisphaerica]|uniref:uncharacterized protein n=1 Tax=Clytia hemisphaerica TaxID=252671 RepID=UPI0034D6E89C